jgi:hypothetical protein
MGFAALRIPPNRRRCAVKLMSTSVAGEPGPLGRSKILATSSSGMIRPHGSRYVNSGMPLADSRRLGRWVEISPSLIV